MEIAPTIANASPLSQTHNLVSSWIATPFSFTRSKTDDVSHCTKHPSPMVNNILPEVTAQCKQQHSQSVARTPVSAPFPANPNPIFAMLIRQPAQSGRTRSSRFSREFRPHERATAVSRYDATRCSTATKGSTEARQEGGLVSVRAKRASDSVKLG